MRKNKAANKTLPDNGTIEAKKVWQYAGRMSAAYEAIQKLYGSWTVFVAKNVTKMSLKCHQKIKILNWDIEAKNGINLSTTFHRKKYHQVTTETPPEIKVGEGKLRAKIKAKNINTTYHYLILPNSSFMLCC